MKFGEKLFKQKLCHTKFAVFFPLPSCCLRSLILALGRDQRHSWMQNTHDLLVGTLSIGIPSITKNIYLLSWGGSCNFQPSFRGGSWVFLSAICHLPTAPTILFDQSLIPKRRGLPSGLFPANGFGLEDPISTY